MQVMCRRTSSEGKPVQQFQNRLLQCEYSWHANLIVSKEAFGYNYHCMIKWNQHIDWLFFIKAVNHHSIRAYSNVEAESGWGMRAIFLSF